MEKVGMEYIWEAREAIKNQNAVKKGFADIDSASRKVEKSNDKSVSGIGAFAVAKGMALYNIGVGLLSKGVDALNRNIPFMAQAFDMAGQVLMANLMYPLAQELMPLVMLFFNWVRENRIVFVQLGTILVSVFRIVKEVITNAFGLVQTFWSALMSSIGRGQVTLKGFIDFVNFLLLKIAFVFVFIGVMLKPLITAIGTLFGWLFNNVVMPYIEGFISGISTGVIPLLRLWQHALGLVQTAFIKLFGAGTKLAPLQFLFKALGFYIGYIVFGPLKALLLAVGTAIELVGGLANAIMWFGNVTGIFRAVGMALDFVKAKFMAIFDAGSNIAQKIADALKSGFMKGWDMVKDTQVGKILSGVITKAQAVLPGRERGGPVEKGQPYIVGEKRPEVFVPDRPGRILPDAMRLPDTGSSSSGTGESYADNRVVHITIVSPDPALSGQQVNKALESRPDYRPQQVRSNVRNN